ncbi:MAG: hypothetical protein AABY75_00815, partial [Bacteroidota bacterium]
ASHRALLAFIPRARVARILPMPTEWHRDRRAVSIPRDLDVHIRRVPTEGRRDIQGVDSLRSGRADRVIRVPGVRGNGPQGHSPSGREFDDLASTNARRPRSILRRSGVNSNFGSSARMRM